MKSKLFIFLLISVAFSACSIVDSIKYDTISVKVKNTTDYQINDLILNGFEFNTLESGEESEYQVFESVHLTDDYYDADYSAGIGEISVENRPIFMMCYVFDDQKIKDLKDGQYTLAVEVSHYDSDHNPLGLTFKIMD